MPRAVDGVIWACTRRAAAVSESTRIGDGRKSRSCARVKVPEVSGIAGVSKKHVAQVLYQIESGKPAPR
jgi:hypothetical protein